MGTIDTWITENDRLYIAKPREHSLDDLAEAANCLLREWDYAEVDVLTAANLYTLAEVIWVDEEKLRLEVWPSWSVHDEELSCTTEVWIYDLETIITRSYA